MGSVINTTHAGYNEKTAVDNWAGEYAKRCVTAHKEAVVLDHPDGSVTESKLSSEVRMTISEAVELGNNAVGIANTANATATEAKAIADNARMDADGALNTSLDAYTKADGAVAVALQAKEQAEVADARSINTETEASVALETANAAQSASDTLSERVEVIELQIGDIETALDSVIEIQNTLIGGDSE